MEPTIIAYKTLPEPFENYMIDENGRLFRKEHITNKRCKHDRFGNRIVIERYFGQSEVMACFNKKTGYMQVCLRKTNNDVNNITKRNYTKYIHGLVAEAFLGPRPEGYQVDHKDGNRSNNHISNLEYVTAKENIKRAWVRKLTKQKEI